MMLGSSSCSSSSTAFSGFADDILLEIFAYLPLKYIFKCKYVSKVWLVLLSDPYFINKWIKLNCSDSSSIPWTLFYGFKPLKDFLPNNPMNNRFSNAYPELHTSIFSCHNGFTFEFLNPNSNCPNSFFKRKNSLYLLGSSNGLVLCSMTSLCMEASSDYYVCNPLIRKWVALPPPPEPGILVISGFECELPSSSLVTTRYTVVRIPQFEGNSNKLNIEVFSSVSGEWDIRQVWCPQDVTWKRNDHNDLLILHGVLYWIQGINKVLVYNLDNNNNIKTGGGQCRLIDLPRHNFCFSCQLGIWESEGLFCYASIAADTFPSTLSVWVLEEEWHLLHKDISLDDLFTKVGTTLQDILADYYPTTTKDALRGMLWSQIQVLGFNPGDKNIVMLGYCSYIWALNMRTKKLEELCRPSYLPSYLSSVRPPHDYMFSPAVLKTMPTILPPPTWMDTLAGTDLRSG